MSSPCFSLHSAVTLLQPPVLTVIDCVFVSAWALLNGAFSFWSQENELSLRRRKKKIKELLKRLLCCLDENSVTFLVGCSLEHL